MAGLFIDGEWVASADGSDDNTYLPQAEWGGFKQSGIGRELGPAGLDEYRGAKHIWHNAAPGPTGSFGG